MDPTKYHLSPLEPLLDENCSVKLQFLASYFSVCCLHNHISSVRLIHTGRLINLGPMSSPVHSFCFPPKRFRRKVTCNLTRAVP